MNIKIKQHNNFLKIELVLLNSRWRNTKQNSKWLTLKTNKSASDRKITQKLNV